MGLPLRVFLLKHIFSFFCLTSCLPSYCIGNISVRIGMQSLSFGINCVRLRTVGMARNLIIHMMTLSRYYMWQGWVMANGIPLANTGILFLHLRMGKRY